MTHTLQQYFILTLLFNWRNSTESWDHLRSVINTAGTIRNIDVRWVNHCCSGKAIYVTYSECVFSALGIQHAVRMSRIMLSSVACTALQYFSTSSHKRSDFLKKKKLNVKCVFLFSSKLLPENFLHVRIIQRDMIKNVHWSSRKVPVILVRFDWNLNFLGIFSENIQISNLMRIRAVGAELFQVNGQTWRS